MKKYTLDWMVTRDPAVILEDIILHYRYSRWHRGNYNTKNYSQGLRSIQSLLDLRRDQGKIQEAA